MKRTTMTLGFRFSCHVVVIAVVAMHVTQTADLIPFMSWEDLTNPAYKLWGYGFPPNTTLLTLLPKQPGIDDYFHELYVRADGDVDDFWAKVSEAYADGYLVYDPQLVSAAYIFYVCRALRGRIEFCPSPCKGEPCADTGCNRTGTGLFSNNYRCQCPMHYHWHPIRLRCIFCGEDFRWNEARLVCELIHGYGANQLFEATQAPPNLVVASRWRAWSTWSVCSNTCGEGERVRRRSCRGHAPSACVGSAMAKQACRDDSSCYNKPLVYTAMVSTLIGFGVAIAAVTMGRGDDSPLSDADIERAKKERKKRRNKKKKKRVVTKRRETMREASVRRATARRETIRRATIRRSMIQPNGPRKSIIRKPSTRSY